MPLTITRTNADGVQVNGEGRWLNYSRTYQGPRPLVEGGSYDLEVEEFNGRLYINRAQQNGSVPAAITPDLERNRAIIAESCLASAARVMAAWAGTQTGVGIATPDELQQTTEAMADQFIRFVLARAKPTVPIMPSAPPVQTPAQGGPEDDVERIDLESLPF